VNRGKYEVGAIVEACRSNDVTDMIVLHEHRGVPDGLVVSHLPFGPTAFFTLANVVTRHDILMSQSGFPQKQGDGEGGSSHDDDWMSVPKTISEAFPHIVLDGFTSRLGRRVSDVLRFLFPVPRPDSRRVVTFANRNDTIAFRQHTFTQKSKNSEPELTEIGPRFDMRLYKLVQGTLEQTDSADLEFVLRPYMNTARKRKFLSTEESQSTSTIKIQ
jgi:U3 small nucleolar ribonucleoprotein protein IMP4